MLYTGDALTILRSLADDSVDCCVTSPPYWGLRDYNVVGQLGLERTPEEYVLKMVEIFREVRRVLRDSGVCFLNLGDSYFSDTKGGGWVRSALQNHNPGTRYGTRRFSHDTLKPKQLVGIPWRVAFALQADGWWLRQDIIWQKPDPMPESVKDRCTKAHEYIFLLTKSARYYWDGDAIAEEALNTSGWAKQRERGEPHQHIKRGSVYLDGREECQYGLNNATNTERRNARSVWTISGAAYGGVHCAVFPLELPKRCILAGCPHKVCSLCGKPYKRRMQKPEMMQVDNSTVDRYGNGSAGIHRKIGQAYQNWRIQNPDKCLGYFPTCSCNAPSEGGVVLDPFAGSGTTLFMARELGCRYIGIELNPEYIALIEKRLEQGVLFGA